jgi:hypothetical protein
MEAAEGTMERDVAGTGQMGLPEGEAHEPRARPNPSSVEPPRRTGLEERGTRRGQPDRAESLPTRSRGGIQPEAGSDSSHEVDPVGPADQTRTPEVEGSAFAYRPESEPAARGEERFESFDRPHTARPEIAPERAAARTGPASWGLFGQPDPRGREIVEMARDYPPASDAPWQWQQTDSEATEEPLEREEVDERQRARGPDGPSQAGERTQRYPTIVPRGVAEDEWLRGIRRWQATQEQHRREQASEAEARRERRTEWPVAVDPWQAEENPAELPRNAPPDRETGRPGDQRRRPGTASSVGGSSVQSAGSQRSTESTRERTRQRTLELEVQLAQIRLRSQEQAAQERQAEREEAAARHEESRQATAERTAWNPRSHPPPLPLLDIAGERHREAARQVGERAAREAATALAPNAAVNQPNPGIGALGERSYGTSIAWRGYAPAREAPRPAEQRQPREEAPSRSPPREPVPVIEPVPQNPGSRQATARVPQPGPPSRAHVP